MPRGNKAFAIDYWKSEEPGDDPDLSDYDNDKDVLEQRYSVIAAAQTCFRSAILYKRDPAGPVPPGWRQIGEVRKL